MKATLLLHNLGQSLWLDNITRDLLNNGALKRYIDELSVTGLTSNPTIFDHAIKNSTAYDAAIRKKLSEGKSGEDLFFELALEDLTQAADLFRPIYDRTNGVDGWVSLEVSPLLAHDTASTIAAAKRLHTRAGRPNLLIKIPGTKEGLPAIEPHEPETEYGYVVPDKNVTELCRFGTRRVSAFVEKPRTELASELMMAGGLWNTMTMVFKVDTLLQLVRRVHPVVYFDFCRILKAPGTREEQSTIDEVYQNLEPANFSKQILERIAVEFPKSISVLPVREVFWSDLGSRERVLRVARRHNRHKLKRFQAGLIPYKPGRSRGQKIIGDGETV